MIHRKREGPASRHVPEDPPTADMPYGAGQERIRRNESGRKIEIADVVALEVQRGEVAVNFDLCLERWDEREATMREGA